jgi:hypothetical protein
LLLYAWIAPPGSGAGISYEPQDGTLRLALKLHNTTPDQLPGDLQQRLSSMLPETMGVEAGYIRPGCVQLVLQLRARMEASGQPGMHVSFNGLACLRFLGPRSSRPNNVCAAPHLLSSMTACICCVGVANDVECAV